MQTCYLAVDIGASSGRHIIGTVEHGVMALHEVYRFENRLIEKNGHLCWDMEGLVQNVIEGLKAAHDAGYTPTTVGIDTWAVDFLLLDADGTLSGTPLLTAMAAPPPCGRNWNPFCRLQNFTPVPASNTSRSTRFTNCVP